MHFFKLYIIFCMGFMGPGFMIANRTIYTFNSNENIKITKIGDIGQQLMIFLNSHFKYTV